MIILPAIDIKDGNCVRLVKGDFDTVHKVAEDAHKTATDFKLAGSMWLHTVDLDGAKDKTPKNSELILALAKTSGLKVEVGGGIRNMDTVKMYLEQGVSRVILGSAAIENPDFVKSACEKYGDKIAVGIDAKDGFAAANGWLDTSKVGYIDLAKSMEQLGVKTIIYTDISKDGTLTGPNLEQLDNINRAVSCNIIASGGIANITDIKNLIDINMYGAICGKSIYKGTLNLAETIKLSGEQI
ncbi:MAG: 1-(5-phosphoribosyl)-5-[Clostridia bacterium]|nr:1-(5-phosphoribosyl)-5-[(5-phosphoribosylamino)methylideneamino]imidazole-4-carboxamide isomerase [Clostridia bacterium]